MDGLKKGRDIIMGHFLSPFEISIPEHGNATTTLMREDDVKPVGLQDLDRGFSDVDFIGIGIAAVKIGDPFIAF